MIEIEKWERFFLVRVLHVLAYEQDWLFNVVLWFW
jgi:hypothetical protein